MIAITLLVLLAAALLPVAAVALVGFAFGLPAAAVTFVILYGPMLAVVVRVIRKAPAGQQIPYIGFVEDERGDAKADYAAAVAFFMLVLVIIVAPFIGWR
jgi:hypothetical protein